MMRLRSVGIDPGSTGGFAIYENSELIQAGRFDKVSLADFYKEIKDTHEIVIERAQGTRQMGASNAFAYGDYYGQQRGAALLTNAKIYYVAPQWWKAKLNVPLDTENIIKMALKRVPRLDKFVRVQADHGIAEAALIGQILLDDRLFVEMQINNKKREEKTVKKRVQYRL